MTALSAGHLATDFAGGALPALIPFLKERFQLSYTLVAVLVLASAPLVVALGLHGGLLLAVPCVAVAAVLLTLGPYLLRFVPERRTRTRAAGDDDRRSLVLLLIVITFRSLAWYGLLTFVPLW